MWSKKPLEGGKNEPIWKKERRQRRRRKARRKQD
jgi:hypothetical protein